MSVLDWMEVMLKKKILCTLLLIMLSCSAFVYNISEDKNKRDKASEEVVQKTALAGKVNKETKPAAGHINSRKQSSIQVSLYNYMASKANQNSVNASARKLNGGRRHNTCVYFACESLRRSGVRVPKNISNTKQFIGYLKANEWKVNYNLSELKPGDLCFTTNNSTGWPSHVYIFMAWAKKGSMDSAYIVDNQAHDYNGNVYHIRNVKKKLKDKDATRFFMYKP